jgi:hypothetical protein
MRATRKNIVTVPIALLNSASGTPESPAMRQVLPALATMVFGATADSENFIWM